MKALTEKQRQIYDYIISFQRDHGYPPSVREIGEHVGLKSPSTVHFHLKGLEAAGLITKAEGKTRAITVAGGFPPSEADPPADRVPVVGNVAAGSPILAEQCIEDYLAFDTGGLTGEHFALRVALFEDEATVKTLRRKDGHVWLMPENPEYQPIDGDGAQLLGKVVAVIGRYD